jgi:hypothetical protein
MVRIFRAELREEYAFAFDHLDGKQKKGSRKKDANDDNESILTLGAGSQGREQAAMGAMSVSQSGIVKKELDALDLRCQLEASEGPLMEEYRAFCDEMKFERQVWHGGAPNGRDRHKAIRPKAIRRFMEVSCPLPWC